MYKISIRIFLLYFFQTATTNGRRSLFQIYFEFSPRIDSRILRIKLVFFKFKLWSESIWLSRTWNVIKVRDKNSSIFLFYCHKGFKFGSLRSTITMLIFYLYIDLYVTARFDLHILVSHTIGYTFKSIGNRVFRSRIIFSN